MTWSQGSRREEESSGIKTDVELNMGTGEEETNK
jgi:hypothetical protein